MIPTALRLVRIVRVTLKYGLDQIALSGFKHPWMARVIRVLTWGRVLRDPRGVRLRQALEDLGPIFVKFGQVLSTRRDLMPQDIADALANLQDRVGPFPSEQAVEQIEKALGKKIDEVFTDFEMTPVASASIAQVHFAKLKSGKDAGREVAIKVLRPNMATVIDKDIALLRIVAGLVERLWADGKRLKPIEVVNEFDTYLHDELDLVREAANCSQLRRNFMPGSPREHLLSIPEVFWDYCVPNVMVMERMHGIPISQIQQLREAGVDMQKLSRDGVEIFFSQVFGDGFFHADMHPGNIYVSTAPASLGRYIALDFGIVGTLSEFDKNYLAQNFLAFFQRDYRRVAELHIESRWAPSDTRVEQLEAAVRTCCEPYFDRPLKEISLGQVLLRLFQTSRRFNVEVQPQLVLLQKTLLNIEGLGRQLDPELDLWKTAKPYLEKWMQERIGIKGMEAKARQEAALWARTLPELPRLIHEKLTAPDQTHALLEELKQLRLEQQHTNRLYSVAIAILLIMAFAAVWQWVR